MGKHRSCGCLLLDSISKHGHTTSNGSPSPTYRSWQAMKDRCGNANNPAYHRYGGRGITVCNRWLDSFPAFLADMGERPADRTLDRIDNDGKYEPGNCRWATTREQTAAGHRTWNPDAAWKGPRNAKGQFMRE